MLVNANIFYRSALTMRFVRSKVIPAMDIEVTQNNILRYYVDCYKYISLKMRQKKIIRQICEIIFATVNAGSLRYKVSDVFV